MSCSSNAQELIEAKRVLYGLLLRKEDPSYAEIKVMYELIFDSDIQKLVQKALNIS